MGRFDSASGGLSTNASGAWLEARNRGYALTCRRAPAAEAMTAPPNTPSMSTSTRADRAPVRSSARARARTAVISSLAGPAGRLQDRTEQRGGARRLANRVVHHVAVAHLRDPVRSGRHVVVVGHQQDGLPVRV